MKKTEYTIGESKIANGKVVYLTLIPKNKKDSIYFRPGQYALLSFLRGSTLSQERPFSFASSPENEDHLQFGFKIFGQFTGEFAGLKKGDSVFVRGPYGAFIFDEKKNKDVVFLAAGIGITPFMSAFHYATRKELSNKLTLIFSNRTIPEISFYEEIKNIETHNKNFKAIFAITNSGDDLPKGFVAGRINEGMILDNARDNLYGKVFFICGPQPFTDAAIFILKRLGVKEKNIRTEGFTLSPKSFFEKGSWAFPAIASASALLMLVGLYSINQTETNKAIAKAEKINTNITERLGQITTLDQKIIDRKNALLKEQAANTKTVVKRVSVPITTVIPPQKTPVVTKPTPTPTVPVYVPPKPTTPRTTVS
ncbi:MAG: FAD-dependent oxidoreductase [Candidatus Gracilibacteria bacterium]